MGEFIKSNDYDYEVETKFYADGTVVEREVYRSIKVIDLLNKIARGEEAPNKIKIDNAIYLYDSGTYITNYMYFNEENEDLWLDELSINDEVEIIEDIPKEDKKIEKLSDELTHIKLVDNTTFRKNVVKKLNEIIEKVNGE